MSQSAEFVRFAAQSALNRRRMGEGALGAVDAARERGHGPGLVLIWPRARALMVTPVWIAARMAADLRDLIGHASEDAVQIDRHGLRELGWDSRDIERFGAEALGYVRDWDKARRAGDEGGEPAPAPACPRVMAAARAMALILCAAAGFACVGVATLI
ncbi:hypothetical protein [Microcystis phage vB_MweS-yong2]|nr:hypothetical protein [Microcystis phage vB_MweS-yong2]